MTPASLLHLQRLTDKLSADLAELTFTPPSHTVVDPWVYAREGRDGYFGLLPDRARVFLLGMNPGPWGMAQTGVPFGEVGVVRDWMGLNPRVRKPETEHPRRPVDGMACPRAEVSGSRLWGLMMERFGTAKACFAEHAVFPFCPLMWLKESGANLPPNQLRVAERRPVEARCDRYLDEVLERFRPEHLVAIGQYAELALRRARPDRPVVRILHPSPASPAANRDWAGTVTGQLVDAGVWTD